VHAIGNSYIADFQALEPYYFVTSGSLAGTNQNSGAGYSLLQQYNWPGPSAGRAARPRLTRGPQV
jgi:hypothetical protein